MTNKILIVVLVVAVLALGGVLVYQNYWPKAQPVGCTLEVKLCPDGSYVGRTGPNCEFAECSQEVCLKEGEIYGTGYDKDCCPGLTKIVNIFKTGAGCSVSNGETAVCAYCGNGVCGTGENKCNCPGDCKTFVVRVSINVETFDLANKSFHARDLGNNNNNIIIKYTNSTKFYRMADGRVLNYLVVDDFYSMLNNWIFPGDWIMPIGGFTVIGIMEKENTIRADEVFYTVQ